MKNKIFEKRILYWHEKEPNIKLFGIKSPLYFMVKYADNTKGISWLGTQTLSDFVDGLAYGYLALRKYQNLKEAENSEEAEKSRTLSKPVLDFLNDFMDRLIDSEISGKDKFTINGVEILITREEIKRQARRSNERILRTREDVVDTIKDFIAYKRDIFGFQEEKTTSGQNQNSTKVSGYVSVPMWAIYYYYLQRAKYIPYFDGQQITKEKVIKNLLFEYKHEFSFDHFRNTFYAIGNKKANDPLKPKNLEKVIELLDAFPDAKLLAQNDLNRLNR